MKLYHSHTSPYVRKVMITAYELGIAERIETIDTVVLPTRANAEFQAKNPLRKIPAFETDSGQMIVDSPVIVEYLLSLVESQTLLADSGEARWDALTREAIGDGILDAAVLTRYENVLRPAEHRWDAFADDQLERMLAGLSYFEHWIDPERGLLDIGDITLACTLDYVSFRYPDIDWQNRYEKLANWHSHIIDRESVRRSAPVES